MQSAKTLTVQLSETKSAKKLTVWIEGSSHWPLQKGSTKEYLFLLHNILQNLDNVYTPSVSAIKIYASSFQTKALANLPYMRMHVLPFIT